MNNQNNEGGEAHPRSLEKNESDMICMRFCNKEEERQDFTMKTRGEEEHSEVH